MPVKPAADKHVALKKPFSEPFGQQILQSNYQVHLIFFPQMSDLLKYLNMSSKFFFLSCLLRLCLPLPPFTCLYDGLVSVNETVSEGTTVVNNLIKADFSNNGTI